MNDLIPCELKKQSRAFFHPIASIGGLYIYAHEWFVLIPCMDAMGAVIPFSHTGQLMKHVVLHSTSLSRQPKICFTVMARFGSLRIYMQTQMLSLQLSIHCVFWLCWFYLGWLWLLSSPSALVSEHLSSNSTKSRLVKLSGLSCKKRNPVCIYGGFLKCWYPTIFSFGVFLGYHHLRKHPYAVANISISLL